MTATLPTNKPITTGQLRSMVASATAQVERYKAERKQVELCGVEDYQLYADQRFWAGYAVAAGVLLRQIGGAE